MTAIIGKSKGKETVGKLHDTMIVSEHAHLEKAYPDILHGQRCVFFTLLPAQWTKAIEGYGHLCMHNAVLPLGLLKQHHRPETFTHCSGRNGSLLRWQPGVEQHHM